MLSLPLRIDVSTETQPEVNLISVSPAITHALLSMFETETPDCKSYLTPLPVISSVPPYGIFGDS